MATIKNKIIKNFFSKEELIILQKYCYNKLDSNKDYQLDIQSFSPSWYSDPLMTALLDVKLNLVEKESNLKLFPTYSYWRYYIFGGILKKHTDRPACEISITACIKKYDNWPIIIEGNSLELKEGEAVLYNGCDQEHWRPGIYKGKGMAQVFFHYVNKNGPYTDHAYDNMNINK
tara:strand:+ start:677 stop:1198 length:522 start_codon:yes stop_codon:yes gene_type:complete